MKIVPSIATLCLVLGLAAQPLPAAPVSIDGKTEIPTLDVKPELFYGRIARIVADGLPTAHFKHKPLDDSIAEEAMDVYLESLDFDRTIFLGSDVEFFRRNASEIDDHLSRGSTELAYDIYAVFKERLNDRVAYVDELLKKGFDFSIEETYAWKRKDAPWPATAEERDELWRLKIKNEFLAHLVSRTLREEKAAAEAAEEDAQADGEQPAGEADEALAGDQATEEVAMEAAEAEPAEMDAPRVDADGEKAPESLAEFIEEDLDAEDIDLSPEELIRKRYAQFQSVMNSNDAEWVLQQYLNAFARAYDVHTAYMSPRANEDFDISMTLSLTGIGALLTTEEGAAKVERLIPGGPAEKQGELQPGDRIIAVAQEGEAPVEILYWPLYKSVRLIRGPVGSTVTLTVIPASGTGIREIAIVREEVKLEEKAAKAVTEELPPLAGDSDPVKIGVLTLPDFYADLSGIRNGNEESRSCSRDMRRLLEDLRDQGAEGLVLDLRNNGGGSLQEAIEVAGLFMESGPVVQVRDNRRTQILRNASGEVLWDKPVVVLVNRMSASASEIVAAALQDYGRAIVVGDSRTHGKGTVQSIFPLDRFNPALGALKITTAGFYRINGASTQLKGVTPDIVIPSAYDALEIGEEFLPNVLDWSEVRPLRYSADSSISELVAELKEQSSKRIADDERFRAYEELVARLRERTGMTELPLNLEARLALARADQQIDDMQRRMREQANPMSGSEEDDKAEEEAEARRNDLLLGEAIHILRDLIERKSTPPSVLAAQTTPASE